MKTLWLFPTEKALLEAAKQLARKRRRILVLVIFLVSLGLSRDSAAAILAPKHNQLVSSAILSFAIPQIR